MLKRAEKRLTNSGLGTEKVAFVHDNIFDWHPAKTDTYDLYK